MKTEDVQRILQHHGLGGTVQKIAVGFTNQVYAVDDAYILKICTDAENEINFEKEVFLYKKFAGKIPVPEVVVFDNSKTISEYVYSVTSKLPGQNLYMRWPQLTDAERKDVMRQLCEMHRTLNSEPHEDFLEKFPQELDWQKVVLQKIHEAVDALERNSVLDSEVVESVREYAKTHAHVLEDQKLGLVHWDTHFDNVLIDGAKITGLIDFERIEVASVDFVLDMIKRMVDQPTKYMSEEAEKNAKPEDYAQLLGWTTEFYPELRDFSDIERRLEIYDLVQLVETLIWFPEVQELKDQVANIVQ